MHHLPLVHTIKRVRTPSDDGAGQRHRAQERYWSDYYARQAIGPGLAHFAKSGGRRRFRHVGSVLDQSIDMRGRVDVDRRALVADGEYTSGQMMDQGNERDLRVSRYLGLQSRGPVGAEATHQFLGQCGPHRLGLGRTASTHRGANKGTPLVAQLLDLLASEQPAIHDHRTSVINCDHRTGRHKHVRCEERAATKLLQPVDFVGGVDGTRTRDPRRDRPLCVGSNLTGPQCLLLRMSHALQISGPQERTPFRHQGDALFEKIPASIGRLHFVPDGVRQGHFCDLCAVCCAF